MTWEGIYFQDLGCYIHIERLGKKVQRIRLSDEPPEAQSDLGERILSFLKGKSYEKFELDLSGLTDFQRDVIQVVSSIPRGQTLTYGQVAELSGHSGAARAVGGVMASNRFPLLVPCHRVVARDGLGGYGYGLDMKKKLLELEGIDPSLEDLGA
jgi:methylated-DNA-[protein]-cysteine S-methyltransferase